jgi:hypothetical protein
VKAYEIRCGFDSKLEPERGRHIIDTEPSATISTTKLHPSELDEPEKESTFSFIDVGEGYPTALHR